MDMSAAAAATMTPATSKTSTMLPPRRTGSWAVAGLGAYGSDSAVIGKENSLSTRKDAQYVR
jgi:hypothetical protein